MIKSLLTISLDKALRVWYRNAFVYRKLIKVGILPNFIEPLLYLLSMGLGVGRYVHGIHGMNYINYIAPGFIASTAMFGTSFEVTFSTFVRLIYQKTFDGMVSTPVNAEDVVFGEIVWGASKGVLFGCIMLLVLTVLGLIPSWTALWIIPFLFLANMVFATIGMTVTALVPSMDFFNFYITGFVTPSFLLSGIFFPVDELPKVAQVLANFSPLYHVVEVVRALAWGQTSGIGIHLLIIALLVLVSLPFPVYKMAKKLVS